MESRCHAELHQRDSMLAANNDDAAPRFSLVGRLVRCWSFGGDIQLLKPAAVAGLVA